MMYSLLHDKQAAAACTSACLCLQQGQSGRCGAHAFTGCCFIWLAATACTCDGALHGVVLCVTHVVTCWYAALRRVYED